MEASAILKIAEDAFYNIFLILMSSSATMTEQCDMCSRIHPKMTEVKFWIHSNENLMRKYYIHPSLQILPITWRLYIRTYFTSSTKVGLINVDVPKHILPDTRNIGGTWQKHYRKNTIGELSEASKITIEHMFNSHSKFSADWWFKTRASEEWKTYNDKEDKLRCIQNDNQPYNIVKKNPFPFQIDKDLK